MTRILVDPDNGVPPWRQVRDQLIRLIQSGELAIGAPLPAIRQLANDLGLSAGTVARVYRELETAGILHTARRKGTVVAAIPGVVSRPSAEQTDPLANSAARFVSHARALGATLDEAIEAVRRSWEA